MGVKVSELDRLWSASLIMSSGSKTLHNAATKVSGAQTVFVTKVEKPLCAGHWWSGTGQPEAKIVVGVNTTALATAKLRLRQASAATDAAATLLARAFGWWHDLYQTLGNGTYDWADDGTVSVKEGADYDKCTDPTPQELTRKLKAILAYVDEVDDDFTGALNRITHHDLPVTTTKATPGVSDRAYEAYKGAADDLSGHGPLATLLGLVGGFDAKQAKGWQLNGHYHQDGGKGYVIGPDGKRYEIVVPQYAGADGKVYTHGHGPEDVGWYTVGSVDGSGYLDPKAGALETGIWIMLGATGADTTRKNAVDVDKTKNLELDENGYPTGFDADPSADQPPSDGKSRHYGFVRQKDGTLVWSDNVDEPPDGTSSPKPTEGLPKSEQSDVDRFYRNRDRVDKASNAFDMFKGGNEAYQHRNDSRYYHYRVEFQQGPDGQRRAVVTTYQVVQGADGNNAAVPDVAYVGSDGRLHYKPATWAPDGTPGSDGTSARPAYGG